MSEYLVTTPIYYVNSNPHIGHAYTNIIAGCIKNWLLINNNKVFLLTGTDEHGQKIEDSAKKRNVEVQKFVDYYAEVFKKLADKLEIGYNDFIRTTEDRHKSIVQKVWNLLEKNGYIYLGCYEGWYSVRDEAFYDESEIKDGKAPSGADVEWRKEDSYFFALSKFQNKLIDFYDKNPGFIIPASRKNEVLNFIKSGLKDLSISRINFTWGVEVPTDPKHVVYVWIDALTNYISALGSFSENDENYKTLWCNGIKIHIIGRDILRFHAVYWPAILMACDLPLPDHLIVHGWWTVNGEKMSKSSGNTIEPFEILDKFGIEYIKYFFLANNSIFVDADYKEEKFIDKINSDLVNNFGNLLSRTTNMICQYCNGVVKETKNCDFKNILELKSEFLKNYSKVMDEYRFDVATTEIMSFSTAINRFIDEVKPWKLFKEGETDKINNILFTALDMIRIISITLYPFIPNKISEILEEMGVKELSFNDTNSQYENYVIREKLNLFKKIEKKIETNKALV